MDHDDQRARAFRRNPQAYIGKFDLSEFRHISAP